MQGSTAFVGLFHNVGVVSKPTWAGSHCTNPTCLGSPVPVPKGVELTAVPFRRSVTETHTIFAIMLEVRGLPEDAHVSFAMHLPPPAVTLLHATQLVMPATGLTFAVDGLVWELPRMEGGGQLTL